MKIKKMPDTLLVSIAFSESEKDNTLLVGRKNLNQSVDIINAFQGRDAIDIYEKLITKK